VTYTLWDSSYGWVLTLENGGVAHYQIEALPSEHGRALRLTKVTDDVNGRPCYVVRLDDEPTCSCRGFGHHGHCKHVDALLALQARGSLDAV
jgi:hypothetical protein